MPAIFMVTKIKKSVACVLISQDEWRTTTHTLCPCSLLALVPLCFRWGSVGHTLLGKLNPQCPGVLEDAATRWRFGPTKTYWNFFNGFGDVRYNNKRPPNWLSRRIHERSRTADDFIIAEEHVIFIARRIEGRSSVMIMLPLKLIFHFSITRISKRGNNMKKLVEDQFVYNPGHMQLITTIRTQKPTLVLLYTQWSIWCESGERGPVAD